MPQNVLPPESPALRDYLGRVRSHLPLSAAPDILAELQSSILDRVDAIAQREERPADEAIVRRALEEVGDPEQVADSYAPQRYVVSPEQYRPFLVTSSLLFAVHLVLTGVATTLGLTMKFGPVEVAPVASGFAATAWTVLHALFFDLGVATVLFWSAPRVRGFAKFLPESFRVDAAPRAAGGRAILSLLVAIVLAFFRDDLFVIVEHGTTHPLGTTWFDAVLPMILALLALAVVSDIVYFAMGERRPALALDALHGAATLAVMIHLARGEALMQVPPLEVFDVYRDPVNGFLLNLSTLIVVFLALVAAIKTVRRLVRFAQL